MFCKICQKFDEADEKCHKFVEEKFDKCENFCECYYDDQEYSFTIKKTRMRKFFQFFQWICLGQKSTNLTNYSQDCFKINSEIDINSKEIFNIEENYGKYCDLQPICAECCRQQFYHSPYSFKPRRLFRLYPLPIRFHFKSKRFVTKTCRPIFR